MSPHGLEYGQVVSELCTNGVQSLIPTSKTYAPFPLPVGGGAVNQLTVTRRSTFGAGFRHSDTTRSSHNFARHGVVPVKIKFNILEQARLWLFQTMTMEELSKKKTSIYYDRFGQRSMNDSQHCGTIPSPEGGNIRKFWYNFTSKLRQVPYDSIAVEFCARSKAWNYSHSAQRAESLGTCVPSNKTIHCFKCELSSGIVWRLPRGVCS